MKTVRLPEGLKTIAGLCFYESGLTEIAIPQSVQTIEHHAFWGCSSLESVEFAAESALQAIGEMAFAYSGLLSLVTPNAL